MSHAKSHRAKKDLQLKQTVRKVTVCQTGEALNLWIEGFSDLSLYLEQLQGGLLTVQGSPLGVLLVKQLDGGFDDFVPGVEENSQAKLQQRIR